MYTYTSVAHFDNLYEGSWWDPIRRTSKSIPKNLNILAIFSFEPVFIAFKGRFFRDLFEPQSENETSDTPEHSCSLIRVFAGCVLASQGSSRKHAYIILIPLNPSFI